MASVSSEQFMSKAFKLSTLAGVLLLTACASKLPGRATTAAATPLSDLNFVQEEIPQALQDAAKDPYLKPVDHSCPALLLELGKLNEALGPDLDAPASEDGPSLIDRGTEMGENAAIGALQRTAEGLIPFRSWVRKLSGAERHSRKVAAAVTAGSIRRAFVKGVAASHGCAWYPPAKQTEGALTASAAASVPVAAVANPTAPALVPAALPAASPASSVVTASNTPTPTPVPAPAPAP